MHAHVQGPSYYFKKINTNAKRKENNLHKKASETVKNSFSHNFGNNLFQRRDKRGCNEEMCPSCDSVDQKMAVSTFINCTHLH